MGFGFGLDCQTQKERPFDSSVSAQDFFFKYWSAVLAACRTHKNIEMGEQVSKKIQMLGPEGAGNFVFRSNIHSSVGRWDDATHHILETYKGIKVTRKSQVAVGLRSLG